MEWKEKRLSIWESRYLFSWRENFSNKGGLLKTSSVLFGGIQEAAAVTNCPQKLQCDPGKEWKTRRNTIQQNGLLWASRGRKVVLGINLNINQTTHYQANGHGGQEMSHWRQLFISKYSVASILDWRCKRHLIIIWALMAAFPREAFLSVIKFQNGWWIKGSFLVGQIGREQFHDRRIPKYLQVCIRRRTILGDCGKGGDQLMCPSVSQRMEEEDTQFHSLKVLNKVYIPVKATDTRVWMGH